MKIGVDVEAVEREMTTKGLSFKDLDRRAKQRPTWAQMTVRRARVKGTLHPATIKKLSRAIGCKPEVIAIFGAPLAQPGNGRRKGGKG